MKIVKLHVTYNLVMHLDPIFLNIGSRAIYDRINIKDVLGKLMFFFLVC